MAEIDLLLARWRTAGVLDANTEARIRAFELEYKQRSLQAADGKGHEPDIAGVRWQGIIALILGAILLACGIALFISAHWEQISPPARFSIAIGMVAVIHLAGGVVRAKSLGLSITLHAVGTIVTGAAIALAGQIFNFQGQWPTAILLWALAAAAGWMLLRDQAQQTLTLLLVPAWILRELAFQMDGYIGQDAFMGRILFTWSILYLTFFITSERRAVRGILFAVSAIAAVTATIVMMSGWSSWSAQQTFVPFSTRVWAWVAIAALPLIVAAFHGHKGLIPIALAVAYATVLPWCNHTWAETRTFGTNHYTYTRTEPNLAAHALVALFAVFLCRWGVRLVSRSLVNLAIVLFGMAVAWFYFSDVFSKVGRSLGLILLGILFLAGGWALEATRRRLVAHLDLAEAAAEEAQ